MGIHIVVEEDRFRETLSVLFQTQNDPAVFLGQEFDVRPTTLGTASWEDAAMGRFPKEVTEGLSAEEINALAKQTLNALRAYGKLNPAASPS